MLVQSHTEEVILTLFKVKDQSQRETHKSWEILASFPKSYQAIMEYLLQKIISPQAPEDQEEADHETELSTLIVWRGWELRRKHTGISDGLAWALWTSSTI